MLEHQDQVEADIPEFGGAVPAEFQEGIHLNPLVATFRRSPFVVHGLPLIAFSRRRSIETDVGFHRNGTGSAELGIGTGMFTGADTTIIQRATEFGIQTNAGQVRLSRNHPDIPASFLRKGRFF